MEMKKEKRVAMDGCKPNPVLKKLIVNTDENPLLSHIPNLSPHQYPIPKPYFHCTQKNQKLQYLNPIRT